MATIDRILRVLTGQERGASCGLGLMSLVIAAGVLLGPVQIAFLLALGGER
jgi:hypothetical protein